MAARDTRLLVLGAVAMFEPVNGYQIRRELTSWRVDEWAHVNPGSIYGALTHLEREGLLVRHDLLDVTREVAVYEVTRSGREQLEQMMVAALEGVDLRDRVTFQVAFGLLPLLRRGLVVGSLRTRRSALAAAIEQSRTDLDGPAGPPHARRGALLWLVTAEAELFWLEETLEQVESRELRFTPGEDWGWTPAADDPGWQMQIDREKYRALLGR